MSNNNQREGSKSNTDVGRKFEDIAKKAIEKKLQISLIKQYKIELGLGKRDKKIHNFDLGNGKYIVECKSHKWTQGNNVPSAKLTVWNEAMYYFSLVNNTYKKIFFILKDFSEKKNQTLAEYYIKRNKHLIPEDVEFWEYDENNKTVKILKI